jgi:hypothetical protein
MGEKLTPAEEQATRAITHHQRWATCEHLGATSQDHRCPDCHGTLRRCCNSLVGYYDHEASCLKPSQHGQTEVA